VIEPTAAALRGRVGWGVDDQPRDWLEIPRNYRDRDAVIRIFVPQEYSNDMQRYVHGIVDDKLGFGDGDLDVAFLGQGSEPCLEFTHAPTPPASVSFKDVLPLMEQTEPHRPLLGLGRGLAAVYADLEADAPHLLLSMPTNAGKSTFIRNIAAQLVRHGAHVVLCDIKRHSHRWAKGIDAITYLRDVAEIHNALIHLDVEANRRNHVLDDDEHAKFQRLVLIIEEWNTTQDWLQAYWEEIRDKEDPKKSPALKARSALLAMGRGVGVNVVGVFQDATVSAVGNRSDRENFYNRILALYTRQTWKMLVPDVERIPRISPHKGRVQVAPRGAAVTETQVTNFKEDEAREYALSGPASQGPSPLYGFLARGEVGGTVPTDALQDQQAPAALGELPAAGTGVQDTVQGDESAGLMTLREAADEGVGGGVSLESLRAASKRDPEFPTPHGNRGMAKLYDIQELDFWARNRERSGEKISVPRSEDSE
jgi:hypothetical protein